MAVDLNGKRALVTGGTRGIGRTVAEHFLAAGAAVTVTGTRPDGAGPDGCTYVGVDFENDAATLAFAESLAADAPDILVNNAGVNRRGSAADIPLADFMAVQKINVVAPFLLCQAVIPGMRAKGWGRIVNVSSIWGKIAREDRISYTASKFAIDGMTASIAAEVAQDGILANCVAPGFIDTELTRRTLGEAGIAALSAEVPARRLGTTDEIARLVVWLASDENTYISAQNIAIDGGFTRV